jgi:hypothetical protein
MAMRTDEIDHLRDDARQLLNKTGTNHALVLHAMRVCLLHDVAVTLARIDNTLELIELHLQNSPNVSAVVGDRPTDHASK